MKTGYDFSGWFTDETFANEYITSQDTIYVEGTTTYTIYAKWVAKSYTISYEVGNGAVVNPASFTKEYGTAITNNLAVPTRNGYTFENWYTDETYTTLYNKANDAIYVEGISEYKIYAKWNGNTYTVTLDALGGVDPSTGTAETSLNYTTGQGASLPMNYVKNELPIVAWYTGYDTNTGTYSGTKYTSIGVEVYGNLHLYARYAAQLTVTFNANGGTGTMTSQTIYEGVPTELTQVGFSRSGYDFDYWQASNGQRYSNRQVITITNDITLTAIWKKNSSGNNGSSSSSSSSDGSGIIANNILNTTPNGQDYSKAPSEPVTTVTSTGVVEVVAADTTTGVISTTVSISFDPGKIINDTVNSNWTVDAEGKRTLQIVNSSGQTIVPVDTWACINTNIIDAQGQTTVVSNFYFFNGKGEMVTGWLTDASGRTYFLDTTQNGELGKMTRGWKSIAGKYFYFNPDGTLFRAGTTPDGYRVDANGAWY